MISREKRTRLMLLVPFLFLLGGTGGCKQGPWTLWNSYAAHFIDAQGRVIDPQGGGRTTSEGQSYAMFFALVNNDQARFERLLKWTQTNLAQGDLATHLPAWLWGKTKEGEWKILDPNPASDADVWIAYSLVEAGRLWNKPALLEPGPADDGPGSAPGSGGTARLRNDADARSDRALHAQGHMDRESKLRAAVHL